MVCCPHIQLFDWVITTVNWTCGVLVKLSRYAWRHLLYLMDQNHLCGAVHTNKCSTGACLLLSYHHRLAETLTLAPGFKFPVLTPAQTSSEYKHHHHHLWNSPLLSPIFPSRLRTRTSEFCYCIVDHETLFNPLVPAECPSASQTLCERSEMMGMQ